MKPAAKQTALVRSLLLQYTPQEQEAAKTLSTHMLSDITKNTKILADSAVDLSLKFIRENDLVHLEQLFIRRWDYIGTDLRLIQVMEPLHEASQNLHYDMIQKCPWSEEIVKFVHHRVIQRFANEDSDTIKSRELLHQRAYDTSPPRRGNMEMIPNTAVEFWNMILKRVKRKIEDNIDKSWHCFQSLEFITYGSAS